jgi:hypothetical protein
MLDGLPGWTRPSTEASSSNKAAAVFRGPTRFTWAGAATGLRSVFQRIDNETLATVPEIARTLAIKEIVL